MSAISAPSRAPSILPTFTLDILHPLRPVAAPQQMVASDSHPLDDVASNIRRGSCSPSPPSPCTHRPTLNPPAPSTIPRNSTYDLPAPDLTPRFVFKPDEPSDDETPHTSTPSGAYNSYTHRQPSARVLSSSSPRIYFGDSAITFVPPFSYDFLERDPSVKAVPRNYRAWMRAGRPRLDVEGLERAEAKRDFVAMGIPFPQDSESEESGDEKEKERRRKRKKRLAARGLIIPIERPRRVLKKTTGADTPTRSLLNPTKCVPAKRPRQVKSHPEVAVPILDDPMDGMVSKAAEHHSDSSERRSSSTLLDTDAIEPKPKKKRPNSDTDQKDLILPAKKQRVSRSLCVRKEPQFVDKDVSLHVERSTVSTHSSLSELTPTPEPHLSLKSTSRPSRLRRPSPDPITVAPSFPTSPALRRPALDASHSVAPTTTGSSNAPLRSAAQSALFTSRPGHRANRDVASTQAGAVQMRTFPASVPIIPGYEGFYRRYPLITQFERDDPLGNHVATEDAQPKRSLGNWNTPRDPRDLYTPRYTKGTGNKKIALCPLCYEDPARGGEGRQEWNHTKTSQHNYHMQYYHGISATRCAPFSPPVAQRTIPVNRPQSNEKLEILQGKCHHCKQWVPLEGCKIGDLKVKELFWWKHAASCHKESKLNGESDVFIDDDEYRRLQEYEAMHGSQS